MERMLGSRELSEGAYGKGYREKHSGTMEFSQCRLCSSDNDLLVRANLCCRNDTTGVSLGGQASLLSVDCEWCAIAFNSGRCPAFSR